MKTIKERAGELVKQLTTAGNTISLNDVIGLLQEIANAPEPEPVAYQVRNGWIDVAIYQRQIDAENYSKDQQKRHDLSGSIAHFCVVPLYTAPPANNQSEQHLEMVNPPAPSVPDEFYNAVTNLSVGLEELVAETSGVYGLHQNGDLSPWAEILEGGRFERISSLHVVQNLLATRQPKQPEQQEQPADLVRDAERWLSQRDLELLVTFGMQADDCDADGHTLSKAQTRRLCELGVLRNVGFGRSEMTAFGCVLFDQHWEQSRSLPLRTHAEYAAIAAEKGGA